MQRMPLIDCNRINGQQNFNPVLKLNLDSLDDTKGIGIIFWEIIFTALLDFRLD